MTNEISCKGSFHTGKASNKQVSIPHDLRHYDPVKWNTDGHIDSELSSKNEVLIDPLSFLSEYQNKINTITDKTVLKALHKAILPDENEIPDKIWNKLIRETKEEMAINSRDLAAGFYALTFGDAIREFNEKNIDKHPDRVMSLSEHFQKDKGEIRESIFQLGDHAEYVQLVAERGQEEADKIHREFLHRTLKLWQERNPQLQVICATTHFDEVKFGTPHLNLIYIPVSEQNRGLTKRVSLEGALKMQGYERAKNQKYSETPWQRWEHDTRAAYEAMADEFCREVGIIYVPSEPKGKGQRHIEPWQHRQEQMRKEAEENQRILSEQQAQLDALQKQVDELNNERENADRTKRMLGISEDFQVAFQSLFGKEYKQEETRSGLSPFRTVKGEIQK